MNKTQIIREISSKIEGATQKDIAVVVDTIIETIVEAVASGEKVAITGFGTFDVSERAERQGRNPKTGEAMTIAASKAPKFKAAKAFKDAVNA